MTFPFVPFYLNRISPMPIAVQFLFRARKQSLNMLGVSYLRVRNQRRFDRVKRSQLANHVLPYVCMGVLISPLYPSYLATKVSLSCFSSCLILVRALYPLNINDFLDYHMADLCDLEQQGKLL